MNKRFYRMELICFMVSLLFTTSGHAQHCIQLFSAPTNSPLNHVIFDNIKNSTQNLSEMLQENYSQLKSTQHNHERNDTVQNIVDLNNSALELFDIIQTHPVFNSSVTGQMIRNTLVDAVLKLFKKQGFPRELIQNIINARTEMNKDLMKETEKSPTPIGFFQNNSKSTQEEPSRRTIGFSRNVLETEGYGRKEVDQEMPNDQSAGTSKNPMGFIHSKDGKTSAKPLKSIGFLQSDVTLDVAYTLSIGFDFNHATFVSVSSRQAIGFKTQ